MSVIAIGAVRSCGATTVALGLAATWPAHRRVLLVEADPAGGTLAAAAGFPAEPSLVSLAAAVRRTDAVELAITHTHALPGGAPVLTAPATAEQSERALALLTRFLGHLGEIEADVILDCGRLSPFAEAAASEELPRTNTDRFLAAEVAIIATRAHLPDLHALGGFLDQPRLATARRDGRIHLVLIGSGPYGENEITEVLGVPVVARLPFEADTAIALATTSTYARELRRTPLVRELRSLAMSLTPMSNTDEDVAQSNNERAGSPSGLRRFRPLARVGSEDAGAIATNSAHSNGTSGTPS